MKLGLVAAAFITFLGALVLIIVIGTNARAAAADPHQCGPLPQVRQALKEKYNETELSGGMLTESEAMIVFASPGGKTWTMIGARTDGNACVIASGEGWFEGKTHGPSRDRI